MPMLVTPLSCFYFVSLSLLLFLNRSLPNGIFSCNTENYVAMVSAGREKRPVKLSVVGRPILLALEDIDGGPSFLEKALRFLETYGKVSTFITRKNCDMAFKSSNEDYLSGGKFYIFSFDFYCISNMQ